MGSHVVTRMYFPKDGQMKNRKKFLLSLKITSMSYQYPSSSARPISPRSVRPPTIEEAYASLPESRRYVRGLTAAEMGRESEGRGGQTRGWRALSPQKFRERHELAAAAKEQGVECFLEPETEGYPICPALRTTGGVAQRDCRGVLAAKIRAARLHHDELVAKADKIAEQMECPWKVSPSHRARSPRRATSPSRPRTY